MINERGLGQQLTRTSPVRDGFCVDVFLCTSNAKLLQMRDKYQLGIFFCATFEFNPGSEKLTNSELNIFVCNIDMFYRLHSQKGASLLETCYLAVIKPVSARVCIACSGLMITSLLQDFESLDAS